MNRRVNPEMLVLARETRGITQNSLAKAVSIAQATLSKFETGALAVGDECLSRLAKVLNYPEEFFYQPDPVRWVGSGCIYHRKRQSVTAAEYRLLLARVNVLRMNVWRLLQNVEIQAENRFFQLEIDEFGSPEKIAAHVRNRWDLPPGPIENLVTAIEAAGGVVIKCDFGTAKLDAFSQWPPGMPPMFFVNASAPPDRCRYTLAHEIGHIVMHMVPTPSLEQEADQFAAEFLMPRRDIGPYLSRPFTLEKAASLKVYWKVAISALIRRARDLGRITDSYYRSLMTQMSRLGYRTVEPVPLEPEEPAVVRSVIEVHRKDHGYSITDLSRIALVNEDEFVSNFFPRAPSKTPYLRVVT